MMESIPVWIVVILAVTALLIISIIVSLVRTLVYKRKYVYATERKNGAVRNILSLTDKGKFNVGSKYVGSMFSTVLAPSDYERLFDEANGVDFKKLSDPSVRKLYAEYRSAYRISGIIMCVFLVFMALAVILGNSVAGIG